MGSHLTLSNSSRAGVARWAILPMAALLGSFWMCSVSYGEPMSSSDPRDDFQQTLINAELAIMENLSAEGASAPLEQAIAVPAVITAPGKVQPVVAPKAPLAPTKAKIPPAPVAAKRGAVTTSPATAPQKIKAATTSPSSGEDEKIKAALLARENESLKRQVDSLRNRNSALEQELHETKTQLTVAETETRRLSTMVDARTRASLSRLNVPVPPTDALTSPEPQRAAEPAATERKMADVKLPSPEADFTVATVSVDKAELRLGPGKNNSAIMTVRRGSRLSVEKLQGEWYRVFAPNGERAWIHSSLITFGDGASSMNDGSSVRVKGYSSNVEEEAFRRLQKIAGGGSAK